MIHDCDLQSSDVQPGSRQANNLTPNEKVIGTLYYIIIYTCAIRVGRLVGINKFRDRRRLRNTKFNCDFVLFRTAAVRVVQRTFTYKCMRMYL